MKDDTGELTYLISDHLGSTVAVTDDEGTLITQQRYLPFGGERELPNFTNTALTDFGYTGQRDNSYIKLMDYHFRWYSPELGRFVSPDDIIPNLTNPQSLNRYSYVMNRPINFNDPTGHCESNVSLLLPGYTAVKCAVEDIGDAITAYQAGERNFVQLAAKVTGLDDGARRAGNRIDQLNANVSTVFSNAPIKERFWASVDVGWTAVNTAATLVGIGQIAKAGRMCSFSPETLVETQNGEKPISKIVVGDFVLAWNEADGTLDFYKVTAIVSHTDKVLTNLIIDGEWIETTPEHPFYTEEKGWVSAGELKTGMHIRQANGNYEIVWLKWSVNKTQEMYNLTVNTAHTFFVGEGQWLVHNTCYPGQAGSYAELTAKREIGDKLTPHHMPQAAQGFTSLEDGGALVLRQQDHVLTRTYGWNGAQTLRNEANLGFRDVLARDIWDIKIMKGAQYNNGLKSLINYYRTNFPNLIGK